MMTGHNLVKNGRLNECAVCGQSWVTDSPKSECPGVPIYGWGSWPDHLLTKAQMNEAGFNTGKQLPKPAGVVRREKSPDGWMWLYDRNQGVPKKPVSDKQKAALKKAQERAKPVDIRCSRCNAYIETVTAKRAESMKPERCERCEDFTSAIKGAQEWLEDKDTVILDTETCNLSGGIVQLSIIDITGKTLLNTYVMPENPFSVFAKSGYRSAYNIHGITPYHLHDAPTMGDLYPALYEALSGKRVVIYNKAFDWPIVRYELWRFNCPKIPVKSVNCAMTLYAQFVGDWSNYWKDYRWQPLPGGDHTALGDCMATLDVIKEMANWQKDTIILKDVDEGETV
jgi:DNA polymerase-3 subunit epsilon